MVGLYPSEGALINSFLLNIPVDLLGMIKVFNISQNAN